MRKTYGKSKFSAWTIIYVLFLALIFTHSSSQTEVKSGGQCLDGIYTHKERVCCLCAVGLKLVEHCATNLTYGKCEPCDPGTFSSHPSSENTCESCRSCSHPNENLEVEEPCIPARNAKCRCKKNHYCVSSTEVCHLCHPCKQCGDEGIKDQCAGNTNTVCNEKIQEKSEAGKIVGIVFGVAILVIVASVAVYFWNKKRQKKMTRQPNGNAHDGVDQPLNIRDVEFLPLIPDIALAVGWKDMKNVAIGSGVSKTEIENCEQDHRGDSGEQTIQLLQIWAEKVGRVAPERLINTLKQRGKQAKAEKVTEIVRRAASNAA